MTQNVILAVAFFLCWVPAVAAGSGNDVSSNLFSDLAPLLALFGEPFAQQFMSQSMGWLDHIIFAVAPLGILTAIVGTIRVGGPSWLRALIGSARENRATAELQLMSSTSDEVCELWNGHAIVRTPGRPKIVQLIYCDDDVNEDTCGLYSLDPPDGKVFDGRPLDDPFFIRRFSRKTAMDTENAAPVHVSEDVLEPSFRADYAPNISLNLHRNSSTRELWATAIVGVILQLSVLVYSGFITYYPRFKGKFLQDGSPPGAYAYPMLAVGTIGLVLGMMTCSYVIEKSTEETAWVVQPIPRQHKNSMDDASASIPDQRSEASLLWVQKSHVVSDQNFGSYVISAQDQRSSIITSHPADSSPKMELWWLRGHDLTWFEALTISGTIMGLIGFIVQFEGLRGLHWSASIAQLLATVLMTILRAVVRRGLVVQPKVINVPGEHELDWLSLKMALDGQFLQSEGTKIADPKPSPGDDVHSWEIVSEDHQCRGSWKTQKKRELSGAEKAIKIRKRLIELSHWTSPASKPAASVAAAIKTVMKSIFGDLEPQDLQSFHWSLEVELKKDVEKELPPPKPEEIHFTIHRREQWELDSKDIEAALCLWAFDPNMERSERSNDRRESVRKDTDETKRRKTIFIHGEDTVRLERDLSWWIGDKFGHRISSLDFDEKGGVYTSSAPLELVLAQRFFSSFMWAISESVPTFGWLDNNTHPKGLISVDQEDISTWQLPMLENEKLSEMVKEMQRVGLGLVEEVYLMIIPPLSQENKLPVEFMVDLARQHARRHERHRQWRDAALPYKKLMDLTEGIGPGDRFVLKAMAAVIEFLKSITFLTTARRLQEQNPEMVLLEEIRSDICKFLETLPEKKYLADLKRLYKHQNRFRSFHNLFKWPPNPNVDKNEGLTDGFIFSPLHKALTGEKPCTKKDVLDNLKYINTQDILDWTPLHYAVMVDPPVSVAVFDDILNEVKMAFEKKARSKEAKRTAKEVKRTAKEIKAIVKDMSDWTPLHYVCLERSDQLGRKLLQNIPEVGARGRDGMEPLHCAAMNGEVMMVKLLVQKKAVVNAKDNLGRTPHHWAANNGYHDLIKILLEYHAPFGADCDGRTPLHLAAMNGHHAVIEELIANHVDVEAKDEVGHTPLHLATLHGHESAIDQLLRAKPERDNVQKGLHLAASRGQNKIVRRLLGSEDDKETVKAAQEALYVAAGEGHKALVSFLIMGIVGIDLNGKDDVFEKTPLSWAAERGQASVVEMLLEKDAEIDSTAKSGDTALHLAVRDEHERVVCLIIEEMRKRGSEIELANREGRTPLFIAALKGNERIVKILLDHGANANTCNSEGQSALQVAISHAHEKVVEILVKENANKDLLDDGQSVLHMAVLQDLKEVVEILVERGFPIDKLNKEGQTALLIAVRSGNYDIVPLLLKNAENKADPNKLCGEYGSALMVTASNDDADLARLLIKSGADVDLRGGEHGSALLTAVSKSNEGVMEVLLEKNADLSIRDKNGQTALHIASKRSDKSTVRKLLDRHADTKARDNNGNTALYNAAFVWARDVVELLLDRNADVNAHGGRYGNALQVAAYWGNKPLVNLLVKHNANVNMRSGEYETPLQAAACWGEMEVVSFLIDQGANVNVQGGLYGNALQAATHSGNLSLVEFLLDQGADINAAGGKYGSALQAASSCANRPVQALLVSRGAHSIPRTHFQSDQRQSARTAGVIALEKHRLQGEPAGDKEVTALMSLPLEIVRGVLEYLDGQSLARVSQTCHALQRICRDETLWSSLCSKLQVSSAEPYDSFYDLYRGLVHNHDWLLGKLWMGDHKYDGQLLITRYAPAAGTLDGLQLLVKENDLEEEEESEGDSTDSDSDYEISHASTNWYSFPDLKIRLADSSTLQVGTMHCPNKLHDLPQGQLCQSMMRLPKPAYGLFDSSDLPSSVPVWPPQTIPSDIRIARVFQLPDLDEQGIDVIRTYATLDPALFIPDEDHPYNGIWVGDYRPQGYEILLFHQPTPNSLTAIKITGDKNVPRGEITFQVPDLITQAREPFQRWPDARVVPAMIQIAEEEFINSEFIATEIILVSHNEIINYVVDWRHFFGYTRLSLDQYLS